MRGPSRTWRREPPRSCAPPGEGILAHGRDPYFPPWPDPCSSTSSPGLPRRRSPRTSSRSPRSATACAATWRCSPAECSPGRGAGARARPGRGASGRGDRARGARHPSSLFVAEAYWDLECALQQQGFDYAYDKRLYDRLSATAEDRGAAPRPPRASRKRTPASSRTTTSRARPRRSERAGASRRGRGVYPPGLRLFHEGQLEGTA